MSKLGFAVFVVVFILLLILVMWAGGRIGLFLSGKWVDYKDKKGE